MMHTHAPYHARCITLVSNELLGVTSFVNHEPEQNPSGSFTRDKTTHFRVPHKGLQRRTKGCSLFALHQQDANCLFAYIEMSDPIDFQRGFSFSMYSRQHGNLLGSRPCGGTTEVRQTDGLHSLIARVAPRG
jgi:hypothetical protein